ncbi:hypothetical protein AAIH32_08930 [Pseudarthrobacter oxydans]|uniref:hypothetical protein n=1 Tax=Pseudarthrobacter oxydans TaxID=1671 RepID=UPI003D2CD4CC
MIDTVRQHLRRSFHAPLHVEAGLALFAAGLAITNGKDKPGGDRRMVAAGLMLLGRIGVMT